MLRRAPLLLALLTACGPESPDDTTGTSSGDGTSTSTSTTTATATTDASSTGLLTTDAPATTDAPTTDAPTTDATTTDATATSTTSASTGAVDPAVCDAAALIELKDPIATPDPPPNWSPGGMVTIGVTLVNTGPTDFNEYPGIRVTADHPGVTAAIPENYLFALFAGMENTLSVTFMAAPDVPSPSVVTFTIEVVALNESCPGLMQIQLPVDVN